MTKIEIEIYNDRNDIITINHTENRDTINSEYILYILQEKENIQKNQIDFIRYLHPEYNAFILFKENENIKLNKDKGLKILVQKKIEYKLDENIEKERQEINTKIDNLCQNIEKEISQLDNKTKKKEENPSTSPPLKNTKSSRTLPDFPENEISLMEEDGTDNLEIDIIVLTANPLLDTNERYLRTLNDFNSISYKIYKIINGCKKQIRAQFLPLTKNNFESAINKRPKILHLICKSTYELQNNENKEISNNKINNNEINNNLINNNNDINNKNNINKYIVNLLFENESCEVERINKDDLNNVKINQILLKECGALLDNTNLFISTPLAEDVYEMVKDFSFSNILVQHTTLANIDLISELNGYLYSNILNNLSIQESLGLAKKK